MNRAAVTPGGATPPPPSKRLQFDRRYGWVIDEWKDPSEEALSGGRGMFCIVPLAKALLKTASDSFNVLASSTLKVLEKPDLLSPQVIQSNFKNQVDKIGSIKKPEFNLMVLKTHFLGNSTSCSSDPPEESTDSTITDELRETGEQKLSTN